MLYIKNNLLILLALLLVTSTLHAQQTGTEIQNQHIQQLIQIWGLVKYRSPKSVDGQFDADQTFLQLVDNVKNADDIQFNQLMTALVPPLSSLAENKIYDRSKSNHDQYMVNNVDYRWINNKKYSKGLKQQLTALTNQINLSGKHHYIPSVWYEGDLPNEPAYATYKFDQEGMNLLALAKAWNAVEYLFPYKYMIGKDWKEVLKECIPMFRKIHDRQSYEKSVLLLGVAVNDTHAAEFSNEHMRMAREIFNVRYYPPFDYKAEPDGIIVQKFLNDSLAKSSALHPGDQIVAIGSIKIEQWLKERAAMLPASNEAVKYRSLSTSNNNRGDTFAFSNLDSGTVNVTVRREGKLLHFPLALLDLKNKENVRLVESDIIGKREKATSIKGREDIGTDVTMFRAGNFFEKDLPKAQELDKLSAELKSKKAIIFDMRAYPQAPALFSYYLPLVLGKGPFIFARYYAVNLEDVGTFKHREGLENYMYVAKDGVKRMGELYTGKIVILTDEHTQSMGEWFSMMLRQLNNNTTVIGSQTAGADGDVKRITIPGDYSFSFTGNAIAYPDGKETQRIGIIPDIYFKPSAKDLSGTTDAQLQRALKYINEGK